MERQYKFRAWDINNKKMFRVDRIDYRDDNFEIREVRRAAEYPINVTDQMYYDLLEIELMQFTGLTDKNGKEIYEHSELDGAYEVIFKDLRYSLRHIHNNDIIDLYDYWRDKNGEIEVTREYTKV